MKRFFKITCSMIMVITIIALSVISTFAADTCDHTVEEWEVYGVTAHQGVCATCGDTVFEYHDYVDDVCTFCGLKEPYHVYYDSECWFCDAVDEGCPKNSSGIHSLKQPEESAVYLTTSNYITHGCENCKNVIMISVEEYDIFGVFKEHSDCSHNIRIYQNGEKYHRLVCNACELAVLQEHIYSDDFCIVCSGFVGAFRDDVIENPPFEDENEEEPEVGFEQVLGSVLGLTLVFGAMYLIISVPKSQKRTKK